MELSQTTGMLEAAQAAAVHAAGMPTGIVAAEIDLIDLPTGIEACVVSIVGMEAHSLELRRRLAEVGFLPGERVRIVARGFLSREPLAVRIGTATFALRRFEAACIRVRPELPPAR